MLERQEKCLRLSDMRQSIKKIVCHGVAVLGISIILAGCSSAKLSEAQIDEVEIYISHYISGMVEETLTDEETVNKYVAFFDGSELQEKSEDIVVSELDGGGWDCVSFKSQGKIIKQYVIYGDEFICEEEGLVNNIIKMKETMGNDSKEWAKNLDSHKWYVLSDEDSIEWKAYKVSLVQ